MTNHYPIQVCCDCALVNECDPCDNRYACGYDDADIFENMLRTEELEADREFHQFYV